MDDEPRRLTALHLHVEAVVAELGGSRRVVVRDRLDALDVVAGNAPDQRRAATGGRDDPGDVLPGRERRDALHREIREQQADAAGRRRHGAQHALLRAEVRQQRASRARCRAAELGRASGVRGRGPVLCRRLRKLADHGGRRARRECGAACAGPESGNRPHRRRLAEQPAVGDCGRGRHDEDRQCNRERDDAPPPERALRVARRCASEVLADDAEVGGKRAHGVVSPPLMTAAHRSQRAHHPHAGGRFGRRHLLGDLGEAQVIDHAQLERLALIGREVAERVAQLAAGLLGREPVVRIVDLDCRGVGLLHPELRPGHASRHGPTAGRSGTG